MPTQQAQLAKPRILHTGIALGESPRWHRGRLWLSDWGAQEILAIDLEGRVERIVQVPFALPFCFDFLPDGRLLIVAGREARLVRHEPDGRLVTHADLSAISATPWNEIAIDSRGNAYINNAEAIALVPPSGDVRRVADGGQFPNGMAITPDNKTLIMAESHGKQLTAFDIAEDGALSNRRTWAALDGYPDGICFDAEGAIWYADVPNKCCVRIREGGEVVDTVHLDRGAFSCALGGPEGRTLFIVANEWRGMDKIPEVVQARTGQLLAVRVSIPAAARQPIADRT